MSHTTIEAARSTTRPRGRGGVSTDPITPAEQDAALAAAREALAAALAQEREAQAQAAIDADRVILGEWARRLAELADRLPNAQTESGRELVGRLRTRLAIVANDLILAGMLVD